MANYQSPKTVLGFFAIVTGILATTATVVTGICSKVPALHRLIVPILVFTALVFVVVLVGIFVTAWKDPTILMLGQISGEVYIENRKLTLGDSSGGEFTQELLPTAEVDTTRLLESESTEEGA